MRPGAIGIAIVGLSLIGALGAVYLLQYLYTKRDRPGASWFMGNIAAVALFCLAYGGGLLVFDPTVRLALEMIAITAVCFMGPFFLAFGLDYTGRPDLITTPAFGIVAAVPIVTTGLAVTTPFHQLLWTDFQFASVFGLATVTYTIQPWGIFALLFSIGTAAIGSLLLIGAILSYGPLYRREATAVILSTAPPSIGVFLWMFELGPLPELHLTAPLMVLHVLFDGYAFIGTHMFETSPATQRMAEQSGLDNLPDPVFVVDPEEQIVRANTRGTELVFESQVNSLPVSVETALGVGLETLRETGEYTVSGSNGGIFAVSYTPLRDSASSSVGGMLMLYDITEERQREQQLAVLNRVLRHNLRNETTVISGYAELLETDIEDPGLAGQAAEITAASDRLLTIAEDVQAFERVQQRTVQPEIVTVAEMLTEIAEACSTAHADAVVDWTVTPSELRHRTDPVLLSSILKTLIENGIAHADAAEPRVEITVSGSSERTDPLTITVRDENEPIPEIELETIRSGDETPLQHGQGIGLWTVYWSIQKLHGDLEFAYDDGNVLTITIPDLR